MLLEVSAFLATHFKSLKSALKTNPISGEIIPPVNYVTTCLKAAHITKPMAISTKLPFMENSLNSLSILTFFLIINKFKNKKILVN